MIGSGVTADHQPNTRPSGEPDWSPCWELLRTHARTFSFGSRFLPTDRRNAIAAAYAWCRIADDIVDRAEELELAEISAALDRWEAELDAPVHPVSVAFAVARDRYEIPDQPLRDLLTGMRQDLAPRAYADWDDLREYCYRVAGTIGLVAAPVFGCRDDRALRHAVDLGIAMQLTNILRDVAEDAAMGRVYLPADGLARFGVEPGSILAGAPTGDLPGLMRAEIARARTYYQSGRLGIPALCASGQLTTIAISRLYGKILNRIEDQGCNPFFGRASVSTQRKLRQMPVITADFLALQVNARARSRQA
ncbi:MAG TPA: phytoene/squalene synthase family protein [Thermomicrobiales bacterium]|jgi:phytoene synthase|nr:phytoene/squalene synthase family protein [Thermomicrobiales bacterium]